MGEIFPHSSRGRQTEGSRIMKRDVVIAIFIGLILGGIGALLATSLPAIIKQRSLSTDKLLHLSPTPPPADLTQLPTLDITQPKDQSISDNKTVDLVGQVKSASFVLLESDTEYKIVQATSGGTLKTQINLSEGANEIYISAYDDKGQANTKTLTVFYTSEKL